MRNLKRRVLVVGLIVAFAFGAGLWRTLAWWSVDDERSDGPARTVGGEASPARTENGPPARGSAAPRSDERNPQNTELRDQAVELQADADRARTAAGGSSSEAGPRSIYLRADAPPDGVLSSPILGLDTGAPRALVLWRMEGSRRVRVADGRSEPDGSLHFPEVLVPDSPFQLVLTASEEGPAGLDRSAPEVVQLGQLVPPQVRATRDEGGAPGLRITASRSLGAVVVTDGDGLEVARAELPRVPLPGRRFVEVPLAPDAIGTFLVTQELPDGSRSAWQTIDLPEDEQ